MPDDVKGREHLLARRKALFDVFRAFSGRWRAHFHPNRAEELMPIWLVGIEQLELDGLADLAVRYAATASKFPPAPDEFASYVRREQEKRFGVAAPAPTAKRRVWEWVSPLTGRINRVEEFADGFACSNLDDQREFDAFTAAGKVEYCEHMVHQYSASLRRTA